MRFLRATSFVCLSLLGLALRASSQTVKPNIEVLPNVADSASVSVPTPGSFDELIGRVVEREHVFNQQILGLHPLLETYIQNLRDDDEMGPVPVSDRYFLGRLDLGGKMTDRYVNQAGQSIFSKLNVLPEVSELYSYKYLPAGFAQMVLVDRDFNRKSYHFTYVRREFLGEVRCVVIDVQPVKGGGDGRFVGRIWVEDEDYNIVRFNGTYNDHGHLGHYLHFDSWRLNMRPGMWLPTVAHL